MLGEFGHWGKTNEITARSGAVAVLIDLFLRTHQRPVLDTNEIAALEASFARTQEFIAKQIVVREQVPLTQCTLLLDGFVERYKDMADGRRQNNTNHNPNKNVDLHSYPLKKLEHSVAASIS